MLVFAREGRKKKTQERERERDLSVFFSFWLSELFAVVIKSSRARTPRAMNSYPVVIIIAKKKRELSFVTRSLSLCVLVVVVCFHFSPPNGSLDTKIKTLFPPLSLVWTKVCSHHRLKCVSLCNQRTPRVLHKKPGSVFLSSSPRVFSSSSTREREREREKKKEREERAKTTDENFVSTKYAKRGEKTSRCCCFSAATRERERDRLRNTLYNHAVLS